MHCMCHFSLPFSLSFSFSSTCSRFFSPYQSPVTLCKHIEICRSDAVFYHFFSFLDSRRCRKMTVETGNSFTNSCRVCTAHLYTQTTYTQLKACPMYNVLCTFCRKTHILASNKTQARIEPNAFHPFTLVLSGKSI